jgi:hypothetical protein
MVDITSVFDLSPDPSPIGEGSKRSVKKYFCTPLLMGEGLGERS